MHPYTPEIMIRARLKSINSSVHSVVSQVTNIMWKEVVLCEAHYLYLA